MIGLAAVLETGSHRWGLWVALGVGAAVVVSYAVFLGREYMRNRRDSTRQS